MDEAGDTRREQKEMEKFNCLRESPVHQVICAILINIPVFCCGMEVGWMSPMIILFQSNKTPTKSPLTDDEISWLAAAAYFSCLPMVPIIAGLSDKVGRKRVLIFVSVSSLACWIAKLYSAALRQLMMARLLIGVTMAGSQVLCPLYTHEISVHSTKKIMAPMGLIFHTAGIFILYVMGNMLAYRMILWSCLSVPLVQIMLFLMMPESPYFLVKKNRIEEAKRALAYLRSRPREDQALQQEIECIQHELEKYRNSEKVLTHFQTNKAVQKAFTINLLLFLAQKFCGATCIQTFAGKIFSIVLMDQEFHLSANVQAMVMGVVQFCGSISGYYMLRITTRKSLITRSGVGYALFMFITGTWFIFSMFYDIKFLNFMPVVCLSICLFWYAAGFLPTIFMVAWELYTIKHRESMLTITTTAAAAADCLQMAAFIPITNANGIYAAFYFFGIVSLATVTFVCLKVPETKNRRVSEIYTDLAIVPGKGTENEG